MRVTNASTYRNFTSSVNSVHLSLNKSMNKISSGEAYENAAESPSSYYEGKKIDSQFQDTISKVALIKDVRNRVYQQELGARTIQGILSNTGGAKTQVQFARTDTTSPTALQTTMEDLLQKGQEIVDALNTQYEDFFVYGGNDYSTPPFSLKVNLDENDPNAPETLLTYSHKFPGESEASKIVFRMKSNVDANGDPDGSYGFEIDKTQTVPQGADEMTMIQKAMSEQGRMDVGYGSIAHRDTLIDTFTGGLNMLTGISSDSVKRPTGNPPTGGSPSEQDFLSALNKSALGLVSQSVHVINDFIHPKAGATPDRGVMSEQLGTILTEMTGAEQTLSTVYSDLGNKYRLLETTEDKLNTTADSLKQQYKDILGADPYESIMEMYNNNYAYNAALKVGSQLMSSSLFDFVR